MAGLQNERDIADLQTQQDGQTFTTADVMTVGALPFADPDADPKTQQEANWMTFLIGSRSQRKKLQTPAKSFRI